MHYNAYISPGVQKDVNANLNNCLTNKSQKRSSLYTNNVVIL